MAIEPLGMESTLSPPVAPSFMIEPFPNCFSICRIAWSIALVFSVTAIFSSQTHPKTNGAGLLHTGAVSTFPGNGLPVDLFLALRLDDLEGHRLDGSGEALLAELALELLFGLLLLVLVFRFAAAAWHQTLPSGGSLRTARA